MKLLTKAIENELAKHPLYSGEKETISKVVVKFFTPSSSWTWYVLEGTKVESCGTDLEDWEFFGLVEGHENELGYFRLSDLQDIKGPFGLGVERDMYFSGKVNKTNNTVVR